MYSTCIHCSESLGANESIEAFPVGRRLAFDAKLGRLWAVCPVCARWNLTPLEERWEAIEECERRFRATRLRVSTENIGLARLREGTELVRIGAALRPELAAWRYGDQFGKRRQRSMLVAGAVVGSAATILGGAMWLGAGVFSFGGVYFNGALWDTLVHGRPGKRVARIKLPNGRIVNVQRRHARMSVLERFDPTSGDGIHLRLESELGTHRLSGSDALGVAARILPTVNRFGGTRAEVRSAVELLDEVGDVRRLFTAVQRRHGAAPGDRRWAEGAFWRRPRSHIEKLPGTLHSLDVRDRLALEMSLHEESERRAMDGALAELERAWREAEEIAAIADDMLMPQHIDERVAAMRTGGRRTAER